MAADPVTVLHVDDDTDFAALAVVYLERVDDGIDVLTEHSVDDGLERMRAESVDCIVSDYQMPETDGLEFLHAVRERGYSMPFILFTGQGSEEIASEAISAGVDEYLRKVGGEDRYELLANRIRNLVEKHRTHQKLTIRNRAISAAPIGIVTTDPRQEDNPIVYVNPGFEDLTGYDPAAIVGENCRFLQGEDTDPDTVAAIRRAIDDERPISVEILNYRADGTPFWNHLDIAPVYARDGELIRYVGFQRDVTGQREARRELEAVLDRISDAFIGLDATLRFTYVNDRAEELLGRDSEHLLGRSIVEEFPDSSGEPFFRQYEAAMETQEPVFFTEYHERLDTEFDVRVYPSETGLSVYFQEHDA